jgi:hypothetical protein
MSLTSHATASAAFIFRSSGVLLTRLGVGRIDAALRTKEAKNTGIKAIFVFDGGENHA